ncbi:MAG: PASTA domain-containing protein [Candidatus Hydrogenedentota bacterium]|nr:MAG: PASTA domain-containing protein [Candidatus Hydrogenedentota bacterium]
MAFSLRDWSDYNIIEAVQKVLKRYRGKRLIEMPAVKIMLGFSIFLASAGFFGLLSLNLAIKRGGKVTVPNVANRSVVDALDILSERGLELRKAGARNSPIIPENYVISQDPIAGTVVKEGTPVSVVISLGSKTSIVPNLVGKSLREARVELNRAGLRAGRFSRMHDHRARDVVLAQSPEPNRQVDRETPVDMLLSLGLGAREYRLPDLIGLPLEKASKVLEAMGVSIGDITTKLDLAHPQGIILDQAPPPGSLITEGSLVSLVMSTLHGEGTRVERKFGVFLYRVPYGFWSKSVRIELSDPDGSRTIYNEVDEPGAKIKMVFGYSAQCTVRAYLDGNLEIERIFR